jgi:hypothetical protein
MLEARASRWERFMIASWDKVVEVPVPTVWGSMP